MDLTELLETAGNQLHGAINTPEILYMLYFITFFFAIFVIVNIAMQKAPQFKGKPGKVISAMVSVIITGSIFYPTNGPEELLELFNGFGGFIFILALSLGIGGGAIYLFLKQKEKNFNLAMIVLTLGIYICASLMLPMFFETSTLNSSSPNEGGFIGERTEAFSIFGDLLLWTQTLSLLVFFIFLIRWGFSLFSDENSTTTTKSTDKKTIEHKKRINNFKTLLRAIHNELKDTNNHFNNKINLLNDLRSEIGRLRSNDKGGNR
jgi:glucan phosphoethanolaminetransferase (alkaline phosphatase superfamily)